MAGCGCWVVTVVCRVPGEAGRHGSPGSHGWARTTSRDPKPRLAVWAPSLLALLMPPPHCHQAKKNSRLQQESERIRKAKVTRRLSAAPSCSHQSEHLLLCAAETRGSYPHGTAGKMAGHDQTKGGQQSQTRELRHEGGATARGVIGIITARGARYVPSIQRAPAASLW